MRISSIPPRTLAGAVIIGLATLVYTLNLNTELGWGDDFAQYILHAQNILSGKPYDATGYLYNPDEPWIGPAAYPPIFPLLLAPVISTFGLSIPALKLVGIVSFLLFLVVYARQVISHTPAAPLPAPLAAALLAVVAFHPIFWFATDRILSELPFLLFVTLALVGMELLPRRPAYRAELLTLVILFVFLAVGTRSIGVVLIAVFFVDQVWRARRLTTEALATTALVLLPSAIQYVVFRAATTYADQFTPALGEITRRIVSNSLQLLQTLSNVFPFDNRWILLRMGGFVLALALVGLGIAQRWKAGPRVYDTFLLLYPIAIVNWASFEGMRFLIPVVPFFLLYIAEGIWALWQRLGNRSWMAYAAAAASLLLVWSFWNGIHGDFQRFDELQTTNVQAFFAFVREETPAGAHFMFYKPRALALFTGHAAMYPTIPEKEIPFWQQVQNGSISYLALRTGDTGSQAPEWQAFVSEHAANFQLVFSNDGFAVYQVVRVSGTP